MTENPLYRRVYGDIPQYRSSWQPPNNEFAVRYSQSPNAAQDLRNLFGNFFTPNSAPNYATQYHPSPYQMIPTGYNPYSTNNISPAQQEINQRIGDALHSYTLPQPQPYQKTYQEPQYSTYNLGTPKVNYNAQAAPKARDAMHDFALNQGVDILNIALAGGGLRKGIGSAVKPYVPYALMKLGATRYGKPIVDGINRFAETPVGKMLINVADFIF